MKKVKVGVLDFNGLNKFAGSASKTSVKEVSRIVEEIKKAGAMAKVYKAENCQLYFHKKTSEILYNNKPIKGCDVLLTRVAKNNNVDLEVSVIKQFELMGIDVINRYLPVMNAKNKLRTMQMLSSKGIPVPATIVVRKLEHLDAAIERLGGCPIILKTPFGSYGSGVVILESMRSLYSALDIIWKSAGSNIILIQEYVAEAQGSDYRAFVVGDKVVAAMQRTSVGDEFRSNLHLGGTSSKVRLTKEEKEIAVKATKIMGLEIAGVDILRSKRGPVIMEVNANPGFTGLAEITGVNVAAEIARYAIAYAQKERNSD